MAIFSIFRRVFMFKLLFWLLIKSWASSSVIVFLSSCCRKVAIHNNQQVWWMAAFCGRLRLCLGCRLVVDVATSSSSFKNLTSLFSLENGGYCPVKGQEALKAMIAYLFIKRKKSYFCELLFGVLYFFRLDVSH